MDGLRSIGLGLPIQPVTAARASLFLAPETGITLWRVLLAFLTLGDRDIAR
jgi:hypothetical protein